MGTNKRSEAAEAAATSAVEKMTDERFDVLFGLRYAARSLERKARLWSRVDSACRFLSLLSGMAALSALMSQSQPVTVALGMVFAVFQAFEFAVAPAKVSAEAIGARAVYAGILANEKRVSDNDLAESLSEAIGSDGVQMPEALRNIAYNDTVIEFGCDISHLFKLTRWQRFIRLLA